MIAYLMTKGRVHPGGPTKTDEFSEKFQNFILQIFAIINGSSVMNSGKKRYIIFGKWGGGGGGGVKGRLEFVRKFIRFGRATRPLSIWVFMIVQILHYSFSSHAI